MCVSMPLGAVDSGRARRLGKRIPLRHLQTTLSGQSAT
jgi:hypothetical protein